MNCDELLRQLNEYVDGNLEPGACDDFRAHLSECGPCQVVVDNIRKTIRIFKNGREVELPENCRLKLHTVLKERFVKRFPPRPAGSHTEST
jgi:anti-sigma factor RsiW